MKLICMLAAVCLLGGISMISSPAHTQTRPATEAYSKAKADSANGALVSPSAPPSVTPRFASFEIAKSIPGNVKGSWRVDAKATEELLARMPRPPQADKLAQWFGLASGYLALHTYEFDGDRARVSAYRGTRVQEFRRLSEQERETTYALMDPGHSKTETLSVSMLQDGNIRIVPSASPEMAYLRWKPGQLTTETATADEVMAEMRTWVAAVQVIMKTLATADSPPNPPAKAQADPRPALEEAVRTGLIRKATAEDIKAFRAAYIQKKYAGKPLAVPSSENALSVTGVDVSRAYVVLQKFTYPPGMLNENSVVFFIPKGVPEPAGKYGHAAIYDFETLTVECTAARTGGVGC